MKEYLKEYREKHKDKIREYRETNKEKLNEKKREAYKLKKETSDKS